MKCLIGMTAVVIAGAMSGNALAQEQTTEGESARSDERVLAGPTVKQTRLPGVEQSFGGADRMYGMSERPAPLAVFRDAIEMLRSDEVSERNQLTEEQEQTMRELTEVHMKAIRDVMQPHQAELASLRKAAQAQSRAAGRDVAPQRGGSDAVSKLRQRQAQIRRNGPNDAALQTKVWNVLSEGQQVLVTAEIDIWRAKMAQDRVDQMTQRYMDQRRQAAQDSPIQRDRPAVAAQRINVNPRLRESIAKLEPEARRRLIERLRQRAIKRQANDGTKRDTPAKSTSTPTRRRGGG